MTRNIDDIYRELDKEPRLTYKVKVLYRRRIHKDQAWEILLAHHPVFNKGTFTKSWLALTKSNGRTPILNNV